MKRIQIEIAMIGLVLPTLLCNTGCGKDYILLPAPDRSHTSFQMTLTTTPAVDLVGSVRVTVFQPTPAEDPTAASYDVFATLSPVTQTDGSMTLTADTRDVDGNGRLDLVLTMLGNPFTLDRSPCQIITLGHSAWGGDRDPNNLSIVPRFRVRFEVLGPDADGGAADVIAMTAADVETTSGLFAVPNLSQPYPVVELSAVCSPSFLDRCKPRPLEACRSLGQLQLSGTPGARPAP